MAVVLRKQGKLSDGQELAVKRLAGASRQGAREFKNEVKLIAKLQHTILVRLIGCCLEKGEKLLPLNKIMGIARGILYRRQDSWLNVVHRDFKAGNVFLDGQMNPKISDFGMARTFTGIHGQEITSTVAWRFWSEGNVSEFIDPILRSTSSINEVERCMHMGLLCIQEYAATRPTMSAVVLMLGNSSLALPVPKAPAYSQIISTSAQSTIKPTAFFSSDSFTYAKVNMPLNVDCMSVQKTVSQCP
ncbi:G-type lectin S-receptor-like serine/threonine-protein kinase SD3-1 [Nymphaea thermarum]|nr:G-type lectin S-receptor-like serine/threonine-protein kinase SD3-1 [Nymphaea thermarum]